MDKKSRTEDKRRSRVKKHRKVRAYLNTRCRRYSVSDGLLHIGIERARNLAALFIPENSKVFIKAALLPMQTSLNHMCYTKPVSDLRKPIFGETFPISVPLNKLYTKTLQVNVWCTGEESEECLGSAQVSLADFSPEMLSLKWYNILSLRFMQPSAAECKNTSTSSNVFYGFKQGKHDKQESDISMYRGMQSQNTKEESSDESTIISSQTSTLTRNQGCNEFQPVVSLKMDELTNCLKTQDEEDEIGNSDSESESGSENCDEEGIIVEFMEENVLEDVLEHEEENEEHLDEFIQSLDKETNTECIFIPEQGKQRKLSAAGVVSSVIQSDKNSMVIKRSQTFSPSAAVNRNHYICRLNRSDSDSSMPLYRRGGPFQRNSVERRSLRWRRSSSAFNSKSASKKSTQLVPTVRTSLDLELDLQAQNARLNNLQDELNRLRSIKQRLELAREKGDTDLVSWLLEDHKFQILMEQAESGRNSKNAEDRKVEKMFKKTSKEIYKLRKTKAGKGKPDIISFKEKMAFFTRLNLNVPVFSADDFPNENIAVFSPLPATTHRRHASDPINNQSIVDIEKIDIRCNSTQNCLALSAYSINNNPKPCSVTQSSTFTTASKNISIIEITKDKLCTPVPESENERVDENPESEELSGEEPKRYEYVVDRVLGVEV